MKKSILIILLLLIFTFISGCNKYKIKDNENILTVKEAEKISEGLEKYFSKKVGREEIEKYPMLYECISGFITEYDGIYVFITPGGGGIPEGNLLTIGNYSFVLSPTDTIYVYNKGEIYVLSDAYEKHVIDDEMLKEIIYRYENENKIKKYSSCDCCKLYSSNGSIYSLLTDGYTMVLNIKEIPYTIVSNDDGSKLKYIDNISFANHKCEDVLGKNSILTEDEVEILKKYIPSLNK